MRKKCDFSCHKLVIFLFLFSMKLLNQQMNCGILYNDTNDRH
jgi:hypothetical protein